MESGLRGTIPGDSSAGVSGVRGDTERLRVRSLCMLRMLGVREKLECVSRPADVCPVWGSLALSERKDFVAVVFVRGRSLLSFGWYRQRSIA